MCNRHIVAHSCYRDMHPILLSKKIATVTLHYSPISAALLPHAKIRQSDMDGNEGLLVLSKHRKPMWMTCSSVGPSCAPLRMGALRSRRPRCAPVQTANQSTLVREAVATAPRRHKKVGQERRVSTHLAKEGGGEHEATGRSRARPPVWHVQDKWSKLTFREFPNRPV